MKEIHSINAVHKQRGGNSGWKVVDEPAVYELVVARSLSDQWAAWFDGLELARDDQGTTLLRGTILDQAALHGVLNKIRDLNLILLSVMRK